MASPSSTGTSSLLQNSGSEMDQKKRKRMISNRESARRSRMRKQKHLDDLMSQVSQLKQDNTRILNTLMLTSEHYCAIEAENCVLRTQITELGNRLRSLDDILFCLNANNNVTDTTINNNSSNNNCFGGGFYCDYGAEMMVNDTGLISNPWISNFNYLSQPIMASADHFLQY